MTRFQGFALIASILLVAGETTVTHSTARAGLYFGLAFLMFLFAGYLLSREDW